MARNLEDIDVEVSQLVREIQDAVDGDSKPDTSPGAAGDEEPESKEAADDDEGSAPIGVDTAAEVRATLGTVATGLAEQLSSITEEMNKIREELYGESGIGGIAKELEKLKAGGLGELLDSDATDDFARASRQGLSGSLGSLGSSSSSSRARPSAAAKRAVEEAPPARRPRVDEDDLATEELKRRYLERRNAMKSSISIWEKLMLLILALICFFVGSPFFRACVHRGAAHLVGAPYAEEDEEYYDDYE